MQRYNDEGSEKKEQLVRQDYNVRKYEVVRQQ